MLGLCWRIKPLFGFFGDLGFFAGRGIGMMQRSDAREGDCQYRDLDQQSNEVVKGKEG